MSIKPTSHPGTPSVLNAEQGPRVRAQLQKILTSADFKASPRVKGFLEFIVAETLAGRGDRIKGYNVAVEVLGRDESFDPVADPIVRIEAGRLRRALEHYYLTAGANDRLRIEVPKGGYVPEFRLADAGDANAMDIVGATPRTPNQNLGYQDRPTIAVLPFRVLGDDLEQTCFADGLAAEIMIALTQYRDLEVASHCSTQAFGDRTIDVREVGLGLEVRFVLEGLVRKAKDTFRVSVALTDTQTGAQIWANTMERSLTADNLFDIQDDIARNVVVNVADIYHGTVNRTLSAESRRERINSLTAYEAVLCLHHYNRHFTHAAHAATRKVLERAVTAEPDYAMGWAALGEITQDGYTMGLSSGMNRDETVATALRHARKALGLDPRCEYAHFVMGLAHLLARDRKHLVEECQQLLDRVAEPSLRALAGWLLALAGEWQRGQDILRTHIDENPGHPGWLHHVFFLDGYQTGNFEAALEAAMSFNVPNLLWDPLERAAALGQLGRRQEAGDALHELLAIRPDFVDDPKRYLECYILQDDLVDAVLEGLNKAGLQ